MEQHGLLLDALEGDKAAHATFLDLSGCLCPWPLVRIRENLSELSFKGRLLVWVTDLSSQQAIPKMLRALGHLLVNRVEMADGVGFLIEKGC